MVKTSPYNYAQIDGIKYSNVHNEEPALVLYGRSQETLICLSDMPLDYLSFRCYFFTSDFSIKSRKSP